MADDTQAETEETTEPKRRRTAKPKREHTEGSTVRLPDRIWVDGGLRRVNREVR